MQDQPKGRTRATLLEIGLAVAAIFIAVLYFSTRTAHAAEGDITAIFGSVLKVDAGAISLATDSSVIELKIDAGTTIRIGEVSATISDVAVGDRLAATAVKLADGSLLGKSILVKPKEGTQVRHVVGIVIAAENGRATVLDRDGNTVTFDLPAGVTLPVLGEAITAITRRDVVTNRIEARGISRANEIIDRLQAQLDEIRDRQEVEAIERAARLRDLLEDTARNHLGVLAQAAGTVKDDSDRYAERVRKGAQEQLDALRAKYSDEIGKRGGRVQDIQVQGAVSAMTDASLTLQLRGGGEVDFEITSATKFAVKGLGEAKLADVAVNDYAYVEFDPEGDPSKPVAKRVVVTEPRLRKDVAANLEAGRIEQVDGVITHVELETRLDDIVAVIIVVNDERGLKVAVKVAPSTEIFINGIAAKAAELKPGLRAAISIEPEGLIAKAIRAYSADENHRKIEGVIRRIDRDNRILAIAPERGEVVVVSVADDGKIVKDDEKAAFDALEVNDLVLAGTRYEASTGEIVRLIVRSPRFRAEGVISGVSAADHTVTLRPRKGEAVTLILTDETALESKDAGKIGFDGIRPGMTAVAAWRAAVVNGVVRNVAISIVVGRAEIETVRGHVRKLDAEAGVLVVETSEGKVVELRLPRDGEHKATLTKDGNPIESLRPVNIGDEVHKAAYNPDGNVIVSLVVVTPKAIQVRGQLASFDAARHFLKIAVSNEKAVVLAVNEESVITYKGERVSFERLASAGNARLGIVALYIAAGAPSGTDGILLRG
ncbi:MAG: hypothetical protein HY678_06805, partial [Chloroflexi bacterium]|nr:hypothetical protein [Chloroflexota bacterium]